MGKTHAIGKSGYNYGQLLSQPRIPTNTATTTSSLTSLTSTSSTSHTPHSVLVSNYTNTQLPAGPACGLCLLAPLLPCTHASPASTLPSAASPYPASSYPASYSPPPACCHPAVLERYLQRHAQHSLFCGNTSVARAYEASQGLSKMSDDNCDDGRVPVYTVQPQGHDFERQRRELAMFKTHASKFTEALVEVKQCLTQPIRWRYVTQMYSRNHKLTGIIPTLESLQQRAHPTLNNTPNNAPNINDSNTNTNTSPNTPQSPCDEVTDAEIDHIISIMSPSSRHHLSKTARYISRFIAAFKQRGDYFAITGDEHFLYRCVEGVNREEFKRETAAKVEESASSTLSSTSSSTVPMVARDTYVSFLHRYLLSPLHCDGGAQPGMSHMSSFLDFT